MPNTRASTRVNLEITVPENFWKIKSDANYVKFRNFCLTTGRINEWRYRRDLTHAQQDFIVHMGDDKVLSLATHGNEVQVHINMTLICFRGETGIIQISGGAMNRMFIYNYHSLDDNVPNPFDEATAIVINPHVEQMRNLIHDDQRLTREELKHLPKTILRSTDTEFVCAICLDDVKVKNPYRFLPCGHKYHVNCIDLWLIKKANCPECRNPVTV